MALSNNSSLSKCRNIVFDLKKFKLLSTQLNAASLPSLESSVAAFRDRKMPPVRTVCAPRCGSSSEDEPQPERAEVSSRRRTHKSGNQGANVPRDKTPSVLKAKAPKLRKALAKDDHPPGRWVLESAAAKAKDPVTRGAAQGAGADSDPAGGDALSLSQRPASKARGEKDQAKLAVLRTISKVLEENQLTRRRLSALSRAGSTLR